MDIDFKKFLAPFRAMDHADQIAPLLPKKYAPIRPNGMGNQSAYFSEVPKELVCLILQYAAPKVLEMIQALQGLRVQEPRESGDVGLPIITEWEDRQQRLLESASEIGETTRKALILSRRGQGLFRQRVSTYEHACRITKVTNPAHLIASHIKPWRESDNEERLSAGNGLMLTPSIDHLFDRGFISFADDGDLIISPIADHDSLQKMGVNPSEPPSVGRFNIDQKHFLDFHRKEILLKAAS